MKAERPKSAIGMLIAVPRNDVKFLFYKTKCHVISRDDNMLLPRRILTIVTMLETNPPDEATPAQNRYNAQSMNEVDGRIC